MAKTKNDSDDDLTPRAEPVLADDGHKAQAAERVGYCKPPKHRRFQPGQSGNPRGRPKGVKSLADIVRKIVGQKVSVTENGRSRKIPRLEAILLRAAAEASRGDARALRLILQLTERYSESTQTVADRETMAAEEMSATLVETGENFMDLGARRERERRDANQAHEGLDALKPGRVA